VTRSRRASQRQRISTRDSLRGVEIRTDRPARAVLHIECPNGHSAVLLTAASPALLKSSRLRVASAPIGLVTEVARELLVGGAVITEVVFGLPGLGYTAVQAITNQDLPVIIGVVIVTSAAVVVANLLVDMGYAMLDPRVRLH